MPLTARDGVAIAGWTAAPAPVDADTAAQVSHLCSQLGDGEIEGAPTVVDKRGNVAVAVYVDPALPSVTTCSVLTDANGEFVSGGFGGGGRMRVQPANTPVDVDGGSATLSEAGAVATTIHGRYTGEVAQVVVERRDGVEVGARLEDGWWVAWWPGTADATSVTALGEDGRPVGKVVRGEVGNPHEAYRWRRTPVR